MRKEIVYSALVVLALLASACATATPTATPIPVTVTALQATDTAMPAAPTASMPPAATEMPTTSSGPALVNSSQNAALGSFLVDSKGMTLYIFTNDKPGQSNCSGGCATNWPPFLTDGAPTAGTGVTDAMLGTLTRSDGTTQVTYNGWPLYYFAGDSAAGDTNGEGKGNSWYVMTPAGTQK